MIERLRERVHGAATPRAVLFDFDGTLALMRAGWMPLMLDMMMETLGSLSESPAAERCRAEDYVARYTGKDTVIQMQAFADHVRALGGEPQSAPDYKAEFLARIDGARQRRVDDLNAGRITCDDLMVPGSRSLLTELRDAGVRIFLASGTAHDVVCEEAALLRIDGYFEGIYGSAPSLPSKRGLLERLIGSGIEPEEILTFGDGQVEIGDTKAVGGIAVGVASDEPDCREVDPKKRVWLMAAGADYIIPHYRVPGLLREVAGIG
ncbi:MAG: HAD family hydrolase [Acidobacteriota bacterium]|nr:HAD family hydrolase [Acidobacteriota bacterium]